MARWLQSRHGRARTADEMPNAARPDATRVDRPRARHASRKNVGRTERLGSALGGSALIAFGARRRDPLGAAAALLGLAFVGRGLLGRCALYRSFGIDSTAGSGGRVEKQHGDAAVLDASDAERVEYAVVVDRPLEELWGQWRRLENLPTIMRHLQSVTDHGDGRSTWVARGPAGTSVEWDATIINEVPNQLLAWKSLDGADVANAGSVRFTPGDEGTEIRVVLEYDPPAGRLGTMVAALFGENPGKQVRDDLEAFKLAMEGDDAERPAADREVRMPAADDRGDVELKGGTDEQPADDRSSLDRSSTDEQQDGETRA